MITGFLFTITGFTAHGQVGLWEVKSVVVGSKIRTPVAKWFRINEDKTYQSGNGWSQNSAGEWSVNKSNQLTLDEKFALREGNIPFNIRVDANKMTWDRIEFDENVTVQLERINEIPKSPADEVQGLWEYVKVTKRENDLTNEYDPDSKRLMFIKTDRAFQDEMGPDGLIRGYWHMHMHRPNLTLIYDDGSEKKEIWEVSFVGSGMIWSGKSDNVKEFKINFKRLREFPENGN